MLFGLACEGITDQITLENILCGYFQNQNLDEEITELQPPFDETDQKRGEGGWKMLLKYLASTRFRDDVLNTEFLILQIDTDISQDIGINHKNEIPIETLIGKVTDKLIENINAGQSGFYEENAVKIIFAICVHSLECWLVSYHIEQTTIHDCFEVLKTAKNLSVRVAKKRKNYDALSKPFLTRNNIDAVVAKDVSFRVFIQSLEKVSERIHSLF